MANFDNDLISKVLAHAHMYSIPNGLSAKARNDIIRRRCELLGIRFIPTFGVSSSANSNLNVLADAQYTFIRHFNSGSRNYQASDLFFYYIGGISLYLFIAYCYKILGILNLYSYKHRDLPSLLARHMNINLADFQENQEDFRKWIKTITHQMGSYVLPSELTVLTEWMNKTLTLYLDDFNESTTPQFISFCPYVFYRLDWEKVEMVPDNTILDTDNPMTFSSLKLLWTKLLQDYINSDDIGTISGDILKAYKDNVFVLQDISDDFQLPIVRTTNEDMTYILNLDTVYPYSSRADGDNLDAWKYTQDAAGIIQFNPSCAIALEAEFVTESHDEIQEFAPRVALQTVIAQTHGEEMLMSMLSENPSDNEKFSALTSKIAYVQDASSRWALCGKGIGYYCKLLNTGTEVITGVTYFSSDKRNDATMWVKYYLHNCGVIHENVDESLVNEAATMSEFANALIKDNMELSYYYQFANSPKPIFLDILSIYNDATDVWSINNDFESFADLQSVIEHGDDRAKGLLTTNVVYNDLVLSNTSVQYALNLLEFYALTQNLWFKRNK